MKSALTTINNEEKKKAQLINSFRKKVFSDLTEEDKNTLLKFLFEKFDLIKKS